MRKPLFFIIAIIFIGFVVVEKNIQTTNDIKIYNIGIDSCCTYLVNNFVDNETLLCSILKKVNDSKYPVNSFVTNREAASYSDGLVYTNGTSDLFYFKRHHSKTDKFSFVSLFLLKKSNCDLQMKSYTDSCAVYLGAFNELSINVLRCSLNKIEADRFEKKHNSFLYKFCNTRGKCLEVSYMDWGECFSLHVIDKNK